MAVMSEVTRLSVKGSSPYDVVVGHGVLGEVTAMLGETPQRVAVCFAEPLAGLADRVVAMLDRYDVLRIELPDGEVAKTGRVALEAWEQLGAAGFTRSDAVVTVGGGATTDMGGFIAATWLRGVRVVHVPTTLLAMVDAAVGGKTGMNTGAGKNLVGSFHEPAGVVCDLDLLGTLPEPELIAGLGEVVKCGFIADPEILTLIERCPADALEPRSGELRELVERAIAVKIAVVQDDLEEHGGVSTGLVPEEVAQQPSRRATTGGIGREVLNYGHTMAHAIEKATAYQVRHGEAVALGMVYVAELARLAGRLDDETAARHETALASVGLPTRFAAAGFEELLGTMRVDKKSRGSQLRFVVLDGLAQPAILADPAESLLREAFDHLAGTP
jgi:3-dehydroquinate synthase